MGIKYFVLNFKYFNKKIWHEMITFVYDSKSNIWMSKYNIVSIVLNLILVFHKVQIYATHIVVVMEVGVECMCSNTNALES